MTKAGVPTVTLRAGTSRVTALSLTDHGRFANVCAGENYRIFPDPTFWADTLQGLVLVKILNQFERRDAVCDSPKAPRVPPPN